MFTKEEITQRRLAMCRTFIAEFTFGDLIAEEDGRTYRGPIESVTMSDRGYVNITMHWTAQCPNSPAIAKMLAEEFGSWTLRREPCDYGFLATDFTLRPLDSNGYFVNVAGMILTFLPKDGDALSTSAVKGHPDYRAPTT